MTKEIKTPQDRIAIVEGLVNAGHGLSAVEKERVRAAGIGSHNIAELDQELLRYHRVMFSEPWLQSWLRGAFTIEQPESPVFYQAMRDLRLTPVLVDGAANTVSDLPQRAMASILVSEDWATIVRADAGGEWRPPYDHVVFEFQIAGIRICAVLMTMTFDVMEKIMMTVCVRSPRKEWWCCPDTVSLLPDGWRQEISILQTPPMAGLFDFLHHQIRAICIMLDAEVAATEAIRAPHKPIDPKRNPEKLPLMSYHVIKLSKRHRIARPAEGAGGDARRGPRLHFRRGHWRHYQTHKTWIKWQLVGDESLGIVTKDYVA